VQPVSRPRVPSAGSLADRSSQPVSHSDSGTLAPISAVCHRNEPKSVTAQIIRELYPDLFVHGQPTFLRPQW